MNNLATAESHSSSNCPHCGTPTLGNAYCCIGCEILDSRFLPSLAKPANHLDQPNFKELYQLKIGSFDYQLYVEGLHCSSCVHLLENLPSYDSTIESAQVNFGQSKLFLKVNSYFSLAKILSLLEAMGYKAHFLKADEDLHSQQALEEKQNLKKLAVAGACAGNIMLFVIPVYSGLNGMWKSVFNWMSFVLFLPIVFYSGTSFYRGAWISLRNRLVNIDLPITVALLSGFFLSTFNLIRGNGDIYFDSTASFIFLILCSRHFLKRTQQKFLASTGIEDVIGNDQFIRVIDGEKSFIHINEIKQNDVIQLTQGQVSPIDGILESPEAVADISVLNGEPMPRNFEKGMRLQAGARILCSEVLIRAEGTASRSHLALTLKQLEEGVWKKSRFINLTDRCAQILILTVFSLAILFFILFFDHNPQEAFNRSLALIVLACPCALALGSPLALALAIKKAQRKGILVKNSDAFEKVLQLENIFFDKTGTLTEMDLSLYSSEPSELAEEIKAVILGLEQKSEHPIAFAIRKAWPDTPSLPVENLKEISAQGVSGSINSSFFEFGHDNSQRESPFLKLVLKKDGKPVAALCFENSLRTEAKKSIEILKNKGLNCFILSGDSQIRVNKVADQCEIPAQQSFANLNSENKSDILKTYPHSCMIGDGTNDALSLKAADVGIAVKGSTFINLHAADICFTRGGLSPLIDLFDLAKEARQVLVRNLAFSLIYNFIGGSLALAGFVSPWLAAILMPISSVLIILSTLWGLR